VIRISQFSIHHRDHAQEVISELARRGLESASQEAAEEGVPRFSVSLDAKPITVEVVRSALDDP